MKICPEKYSAMIISTGFTPRGLDFVKKAVEGMKTECYLIDLCSGYDLKEIAHMISCDEKDCAKYVQCVKQYEIKYER